MHTVAILALDRTVAFDMAIPVEVFGRVRLPDGRRPYRVRVCGTRPEVPTETFTIRVPWGLDGLAGADTIIVPGREEHAGPPPAEALQALRDAAADGARIASICGGAFTLAATGLLDGLAATTHWIAADQLTRQYAKIEVRPDVLYVDNGQLLTSAGASAGMDLCLHLVRRDLGSAVAADAARLAVTPWNGRAARPSTSSTNPRRCLAAHFWNRHWPGSRTTSARISLWRPWLSAAP